MAAREGGGRAVGGGGGSGGGGGGGDGSGGGGGGEKVGKILNGKSSRWLRVKKEGGCYGFRRCLRDGHVQDSSSLVDESSGRWEKKEEEEKPVKGLKSVSGREITFLPTYTFIS
ncbi:hypothetical protein HZH66_007437 [Vespula vulgaris]|uniref:Uncharacterized protein n=1 Tax=Vespula vulgaris TaxID=7454 RepID=A0A834N5K0_VESVU|nr:hypothetical protein HZH66_007437 [Vespula vulgaris]